MKKYVITLMLFVSSVWADVPTISDYTQNMDKRDGLIPIYYDESNDKVFLAIPESDTQYIFQSSLPHGVGSNDIGLDRGQLGQTRLVMFQRFGNKMLLKQLNTDYRAVTDNQAERSSIDEAFADSVIAGFKIVATSDDSVLIDYTPYLFSDIHGISNRLSGRGQGNFKADSSRSGVYLPRTKAFVENTELEALVTYGGSNPGDFVTQVTPDPISISVHLHHSFVALPPEGFELREYHPYSGYWKFRYFDYATPIDAATEQRFITRHRLEKVSPELEVSEAVEPIVYYLDPGIPEPVMSSLKEGAQWWNQAFEAIGYKDAFQVKVLPEGADPMDVRYNVINWVHRATRGWSYGSSVVDPRTGEIIKGHVTLGSLRVRQDYLIALGLTSPFGEGNDDTAEQQAMALDRIKQLSAHEVGHTLGIAHNFAASENGRASVMDYPHPKIALVNGKIVLDDAYDKGMGAWDLHTVAYGYQDFVSQNAETEGLANIIQASRDAGLLFKSDADTRSARHGSSTGHMWENGSDPLIAFEEISEIRAHVLNNMGLDTLSDGASLSSLENALVPIYLLHRYQLEAVAKQVGGLNYEYERKGDYTEVKGQTFVAPVTQIKAIEQLISATQSNYLAMPEAVLSIIPPTAYGDDITREHFNGRMGLMLDPITAGASAANYAYSLLLHPERLNRLQYQSGMEDKLPSAGELVSKILSAHWYSNKRATDNLDVRLQMVSVNAVMAAVTSPQLSSEAKLSIHNALLEFAEWLDDDSKRDADEVLYNQLSIYLETGEWTGGFDVPALPPGSPI